MNRRGATRGGAAALAALLWAVTAAAQQQPQQQQPAPQASPPSAAQVAQQPGQPGLEIDVNSILGSTVRSREGRDIGSVERLMVDPKGGRLTTVVIKMGGTLGVGAKTLAVPWQSVQIGREGQDVVVSLDEALLQQAPPRAGERQRERQPAASPGSGESPPTQQQPGQPPQQRQQ